MGVATKPFISVNDNAKRIVDCLIEESDRLKLGVLRAGEATVIDAGINVEGSYQAGLLITEICMGGLGQASLTIRKYDDLDLPTITVFTSYPAIALLGSQLGGWKVSSGKFSALGSGPARALSLNPKQLYAQLGYRDRSEHAVLLLETSKIPDTELAMKVASECGVDAKNLYLIVAPTSSIVGTTQISGRIAETGLHKLHSLGVDPALILTAAGSAPVAPPHPDDLKAMGRTNDVIFFAGSTYYTARFGDDSELEEIVRKSPSSSSRDYGKPFYDVFKEAEFDFYRVDPNLFAPAEIAVTNVTTGRTFRAGSMNIPTLKKSIGYNQV
ncbi:MAG: methenyltetrahydromethanopterin cyclohydrolase [Candidatus Bathyarchaeia archaeon]